MSHQPIIKKIKSKQFNNIYFAFGEEDYYIDSILEALDDNILNETEKAFNRVVAYGKDISGAQLLDNLRRYPVMASWQLVVLKEAQSFRDWDILIPYFKKPNPTTVFAVAYKAKSPDKRKKWYKALSASPSSILFESKRLYDNKIPSWIDNYLRKSKKTISPEASRLLSIFLGNRLSNVVNELDKLIILIGDDTQVTLDHVEQNIGVSKHYNIFELQDAFGDRNVSKINYIVQNLVEHFKTQPLIMIMPALHGFFSKVYALKSLGNQSDDFLARALGIYSKYFVKDYRKAAKNYSSMQLEKIFSILNIYDQRMKGIDGSRQKDNVIFEELIQQIIYA